MRAPRPSWVSVMGALLIVAPRAVAEPGEVAPVSHASRDADGSHVRSDVQPNNEPHSPHHLRVWIGIAAGLAVGSFAYWVDQDQNVADWDDPSLKARFSGDAWRLDNNNLVVNFLLHPTSGAGTYNLARTSHFSVPMSVGYSLLSSILWEWVLEFKEQVSINDFIVTPLSGISIGEFFYKLGLYLDSAADPGAATRVAQWTLGTGVQLDRALDGTEASAVPARDQLGLTRAIWHDFVFDYGIYSARTETPSELAVHRLGFQGKLVSLPGYLRPGRFGAFFHEAEISSLDLALEESMHAGGFSLHADTILLGYHEQALSGTGLRGTGHAVTLGTSIGHRFLDSGAHRFAERFAALHLPGLAFDWHALSRLASAVASLRLHPDFAGVGALAQADWQQANPDERGKAVLRGQGYFHGWGGSVDASARLRLGPLRLDGDFLFGRYWSQDGLERHPRKMTVDAPAEGRVLWLRGSAGIQPPDLPVAVGVASGVRRWDSEVGGYRRRARAVERGFWMSVAF